ncbi:MAG TPA: hypothetical protein VFR78_12460 [Pyrinomonadaceae bacterium]|nr:hypothetical protein [Pyrinomonadaceae bacterium]
MPITPQQRKKVNIEIAAARSTLAQKVLECVEGKREQPKTGRTDWINETERESFNQGIAECVAALHELFQREEIEVKL